MKPKSIGIVGGAGPLAGTYCLERIFSIAREGYGCYKDADFPKVLLLSFPFSDMLSSDTDPSVIRRELRECLSSLRSNGASLLAIACNTLHSFLEPSDDREDLVHLPKTVASLTMALKEKPVVFCTSTSVRFQIHQQSFSCVYPDRNVQRQIDQVIEGILHGDATASICKTLNELVQGQQAQAIVFGCTELSMFTKQINSRTKTIIDPLEELSKLLVKKAFLVEEKQP